MSDITTAQVKFNLTDEEARKLFREGELYRIISKVEGDTVKCTLSHIFQTFDVKKPNTDKEGE